MNKKMLFWLIGIPVALFLTAVIAVVVWVAKTPESGVKLSNEMDEYALKYIADHKILDSSEELIAYYDETIQMDGTEAAIVTTRRVIYHKNGRNEALNLADIDDIKHHAEPLIGDIFEISSKSGKAMKIEIDPFNGGDSFKSALMKAWKAAKGEG